MEITSKIRTRLLSLTLFTFENRNINIYMPLRVGGVRTCDKVTGNNFNVTVFASQVQQVPQVCCDTQHRPQTPIFCAR